MFLSEFPQRLFCLCLCNGVHEGRVPGTQSNILSQAVPILVGQWCFNYWVGEIYKGANGSNEGDMFDTCGNRLTDDVEGSFLGDLKITGVISKLGRRREAD